MKSNFLILLSLVFLSCNIGNNDNESIAYLSGEIDNPKSDLIYLKDSNGKYDSLVLNKDNRFNFKIDDLVPGIYEFSHGYEIQVVVLEPGDSIALKLNTNDFDESLAYTGRGSKKNNLLMKLFLDHEENSEIIMKSWNLEAEQFEVLIDSFIDVQKGMVNRFNDQRKSSDLFRFISESIVDFSYLYFKENYPFYHFGKNNLIHFKDLPTDFYSYRSELAINEDKFTELYAYRNYIFSYINNYSLYEFYKNGSHDLSFDDEAVAYNVEKLRLIDSIFSNDDIKSYLLRSVTREYIMQTNNPAHMQEVTNAYLDISKDDAADAKMMNFLNARINMKNGNKLPEVLLVDNNFRKIALHKLIDKPSLIYFWATNHDIHARSSIKIVNELQNNFPDINFIGINVAERKPEFWNKSMTEYRFSKENQYIFANYPDGATKLAADLHHVIIVDEKGFIDETTLNLNSKNIGKKLLRLSTSSKLAEK